MPRTKADVASSPMRAQRARATRIYAALAKQYPDARCELDYNNPFELLIATILSAQATDVSVNKVTPALFQAFPDAAAMAASSPGKIEKYIQSIGLFRSKAKALHATAERIATVFAGKVPDTMDDLLTLRGVARKTANVVLGNAFGKNEGMVVDTHIRRLSYRFGLTEQADVAHIERDLMALFPQSKWCMLSHLLIFHGRRVCKARGATCAEDPICKRYCSNAQE
ncbi:MAG: endonuclease III [Phycisphaerales bacterium]